MGMVVLTHPTFIEIDNFIDPMDGFLNLKNLVDLFLIANDHKTCTAVLENIGHLFGHSILIERNGNRPTLLDCDHRPIERGAISTDKSNIVALVQAKSQ